ncbi:Uncharacterised protein [Pseudomonas aeruginosa]|nr:Uncharacterised protein [Pseudomonas aeruginosa]
MDSSAASRSISRRYRSAAIQRASSRTSRVTLAVTLGLPSRSPPIQDAKRSGAAVSGRRSPVLRRSTSSTCRRTFGKACQRECSITAKPHFASSTGVGRTLRISSVCQASATSRCRRCWMRLRSSGSRSAWSLAASCAVIASYFWISVRRATSVGWAVSTSSISSPASWRASCPGACPASLRRPSSSSSTRFSKGSGSFGRRRRIRWYCSAILARLRNWLKARATGSSSSSSSPSRVAVSCWAPSAEPRRAALAPLRISSILSRNRGPYCSRMVSPSNSPSWWTSSRRRASISGMTCLHCGWETSLAQAPPRLQARRVPVRRRRAGSEAAGADRV